MTAIFKYPLEVIDSQFVMMPDGAGIMTVQMQDGTPCLWALVDPELIKKRREISMFGTGHALPDVKLDYIGTVQSHEGMFVWHFFERT